MSMKAIILAAGIGSRLHPLTNATHKSLLPIGDKSILERMIKSILAININSIVVVTGHFENQVKDFVKRTFPLLRVQFVRNEKFLTTNTGYSLMLTQPFVSDDDFVKFDADVVFEKAVLEKLLLSPHKNALCIDTNIHLEKEEVKVITSAKQKVLEVGKKVDPRRAHGESIGIEKISKNAAKVLFSELKRLMSDRKNWQEYYDDSYTTLVKQGIPFHAVDITGLKWVEIDSHEDFHRAQKLFGTMRKRNFAFL